jgi:hypothetical protein
MNTNQSLPSLSSVESEELQKYRSLSILAVVSLLFGLLAVASLAHPAAWIIPGIAILCSSIALVRIASRPDQLTGRSIALAGLTLGIFFLACAPARYFGDRWILERQARSFVESWLADVQGGRLNRAHQATLEVRERQPRGTELDEFYAQDEQARNERDAFFNKEVPMQLTQLGQDLEYEFERDLGVFFDRDRAYVTHRFWIRRRGNGNVMLHLQTEAERSRDNYGVYWTLIGLADADELDRIRRQRRR